MREHVNQRNMTQNQFELLSLLEIFLTEIMFVSLQCASLYFKPGFQVMMR